MTPKVMMNMSTTIQNSKWVARSRSALMLALAIVLASVPAFAQTYTISPSPFLLAQTNAGVIIAALFGLLAATIIGLCFRRRPSAVAWLVGSSDVDPVDGASGRARPHIVHEGDEALAPCLADGDAFRAIVSVPSRARIVAAGFHGAPDAIFAGGAPAVRALARLTVHQMTRARLVISKTTATANKSGAEIGPAGNGRCAAFTDARPRSARSVLQMFRRSRHNAESSEAAPHHIYQMHISHFIRKCAVLGILLCAPTAAFAQTYTISPSPFLVALNNSGAIINNSCIWTYTAGTTTAATTYSDISGTPNTNPIRSDSAGRFTAFLLPGSSYKYVYESACTPPAHGTVLKTADNIAAVPAGSVNIDVTGTAGEAINAGSVAYLSDGSGGNVSGSWYNTNTANTYSSNLATVIGVATAAITNGSSGNFRIIGRVTGLTGLTAGAPHYVTNSNGALTPTAPTNARYVGTADSTTSIVVNPNPTQSGIVQQQLRINAATPYSWTLPAADATGMVFSNGSGTLAMAPVPLSIMEGRLTCTTGTPVTIADCNGVTSIFYTPMGAGSRVALYDGTRWQLRTFTEITISVAACTASKPYDVFLVDNGTGNPTAEILVWTNTTTRATALTLQDGAYVKTGALTRRYVGSFFCNSSGGQTDDSFTKRFIWNYYNRRLRAMRRLESTGSWTYTTATIRQANGAAANQVEFILGQPEEGLGCQVQGNSRNTNAGVQNVVGIGLDSTSSYATGLLQSIDVVAAVTTYQGHVASLEMFPAVGYHFAAWLEYSEATGTTTWLGVGPPGQSGISCHLLG